MVTTTTVPHAPLERGRGLVDDYADQRSPSASAVSWGAILAGAAAAAALSLILLILGVGLGLSSVSPWALEGISAASFGVSTIVWLTVTQLLSASMGGYLAGRLRTKWTGTHTDEVFFRDTAHGFLAWAVASLATAALLTSVIGSVLSGGVQAGAALVGGATSTATMAAGGMAASGRTSSEEGGPMAYLVDSLFRREMNAETSAAPSASPWRAMSSGASERTLARDAAEVGRIFMNVSSSDPLPPADLRYVGQLVAERTGMSQQAAEERVTEIYTRSQAALDDAEVAAKQATDEARKASAYAALWIFVSLLIGAFAASLSATAGGRQRDA